MTETAIIIVQPNAVISTSGNSAFFRQVQHYRELTVILNVAGVSGTTPTLDLTIEGLDPVSGNPYTLITFTQKTGAGIDFKNQDGGLGRLLRAKWVIGGSASPSVTFSVVFILKNAG